MTRLLPLLLLALCLGCGTTAFAQGGNCEPPTPEELSRMQEMRRSSVAPVTEVRMGGSKFRGTNRKAAPTRKEAELLKQIERLEREIEAMKAALDEACSKLPREGNGWPGGRVPSWYPYPGTMEIGDDLIGNG